MRLVLRIIMIVWKLTKLGVLFGMLRCIGQDNTFCLLTSLSMARDRFIATRNTAWISPYAARLRASLRLMPRLFLRRKNQYGS